MLKRILEKEVYDFHKKKLLLELAIAECLCNKNQDSRERGFVLC